MRLSSQPPYFGLITCSLVLILPLFGSCHPAQLSGNPSLVFMEQLSHSSVRFNWRNVTCYVCKAVFTIVDVALLVMC